MRVLKRSGVLEPISFDKILHRLVALAPDDVNADILAQKVIAGLTDGMHTTTLDEMAAFNAVNMSYINPAYTDMAARIFMSNHHKNTIHNLRRHFNISHKEAEKNLYAYTARALYENTSADGVQTPLINPYLYALIQEHSADIEAAIDYNADYRFDYQGAFILVNGHYLIQGHLNLGDKHEFVTIERAQHTFMRYALSIHCGAEDDPYYANAPRLINLADAPEATVTSSVDWHSLRNNYYYDKLFAAVQPLLEQYLPKPAYRRLVVEPVRPKWDDITEYLQRAPDDVQTQFKALLDKHTMTWAQVYTQARAAVSTDSAKERWTARWPAVLETYRSVRDGFISLPTPVMYNIGTLRPQCSSCFLMEMPADSLEGIAKYWRDSAFVSKFAGGIGSSVSNLRSRGSYIASTNGRSNGLQPFLKVVNEISHYVDQGGGKREGSHTTYIEPWQSDIFEVIKLKEPSASADDRAHVLLYSIWCCDEFMRAAENNKPWYLMDPKMSPGLKYVYDRRLSTEWLNDEYVEANKADFEFTYLYRKYIREGKYVQVVQAEELMTKIVHIISAAGGVFNLFKDAVNRKSAQMNLGVITCSNLCTEIVEYCSPDETAVCTLLSVCVQRYLKQTTYEKPANMTDASGRPRFFRVDLAQFLDDATVGQPIYVEFDWEKLETNIRMCVRNLNKAMNQNFYPLDEAAYSNSQSQPMAIGIQGLADLFVKLRIAFDSPEADMLGFYICEAMYWAALTEGVELSIKFGPYKRFADSPASRGILQHDMWQHERENAVTKDELPPAIKYPLHYDWDAVRQNVVRYGLRNSLYIGMMPTGSSSVIQGSSPCIEPLNSLSYKRKNKYGEFTHVNRQFVADMQYLGLWDEQTRDYIANSRTGGIADYERIPEAIRNIYRTVWDISTKKLIEINLTRSVFIDQSTSFNWFIPKPTISLLSALQYYGWRRGVKTSSYYMRRLAVADAQKVKATATDTQKINVVVPVKLATIVNEVCQIIDGKKSCCEA